MLRNWRQKAEAFALNKLHARSTEVVDHPYLLEQLSTFSRVDFAFSYRFQTRPKALTESFILESSSLLYMMLESAYLRASSIMKRDRFVFTLTNEMILKDDRVVYEGELITHLTPFAYYFGLMAEMLDNKEMEELFEYIEGFPSVQLGMQPSVGQNVPYLVSRVNPRRTRIQVNQKPFIFENGLLTTSDLLTFLARATHFGPVAIDGINDRSTFLKISRLLEKIEDGFDYSEVIIDKGNPENWELNEGI
jgi:hypothetical protein